MRILDTDHISALERETTAGKRLWERVQPVMDDVYVTVVSVEEVLRGRLAVVHAARDDASQIDAYRRLSQSVAALNAWTCLAWDEDTAKHLHRLRGEGNRLATLDLRIACIALAYDATLLTRNLADFHKVPSLKVENWLD
jgi:tRNA(fMet)-specific endonuclease VapC